MIKDLAAWGLTNVNSSFAEPVRPRRYATFHVQKGGTLQIPYVAYFKFRERCRRSDRNCFIIEKMAASQVSFLHCIATNDKIALIKVRLEFVCVGSLQSNLNAW